MDNLKKYVTKIIREAMSNNSPAYKGKEGYDDSCDCYPSDSIKEVSSQKGIDGEFDTALQWIWHFGGKELIQNKLDIYSPTGESRFFKKAMENGSITIQDIDKVTKGEHGQADNIPFSQTAVWKQSIKPYLDRVKQDKFNDNGIDLEEESGTGAIGVGAGPINTPYAFAPKGQKRNKATSTAIEQGFKMSNINETIHQIVKEELLNEVTYNKFKNEVKLRTKNEQLHKAIKEVKYKLNEIDRIVEYTSRMKQELSEGEEGVKYWKATQKNLGTIAEMVNNLNNKIKNLQE